MDETQKLQTQSKTSEKLLIVQTVIIVLLMAALAATWYFKVIKATPVDPLAGMQDDAKYAAGFKDGIQYRNALIVKDLTEKGYTVMYDANDMSRSMTLIPATNNPQQNFGIIETGR